MVYYWNFLTHFTTICKLLVNRWYWKLQTVLIQVLLINMCWDYWACLLETWLTCWWYRIQLMSSSGSHPWILMCTVLRLDSTAVSVSWKLNSAFFMLTQDTAHTVCCTIFPTIFTAHLWIHVYHFFWWKQHNFIVKNQLEMEQSNWGMCHGNLVETRWHIPLTNTCSRDA